MQNTIQQQREDKKFSKIVYILLLLLVAVAWGYGFIATDDALAGGVGPFTSLAARFSIAAAVVFCIQACTQKRKEKRETIGRKELVFGLICGVVNFLGFFFQTLGLKYTDPGRTGMITATYVILVPIISSVLYKKFSWLAILNAIVFFCGLLLLMDFHTIGGFRSGDLLTILAACFFAVQILLVERFCAQFNLLNFNMIQMAAMGVLGILGAVITEWNTFSHIDFSKVIFPLLFLGVFNSACAYLIQTLAQRHVSSSLTAILLSMESVVSVIFSLAMGRTEYSTLLIIGSIIMVAASISASLTDVQAPTKNSLDEQGGAK